MSKTVSTCNIPAGVRKFRRNTYFNGKLLVEKDFCDEQAYHVGKDWLHNSLLHGEGTVCGLRVSPHPNINCQERFIVIEPGVALDCKGREIIVEKAHVVDIPALIQELGLENEFEAKKENDLFIGLCYHEKPEEKIPVILPDCDCADETQHYNRICESYHVNLFARNTQGLQAQGILRANLEATHTIPLDLSLESHSPRAIAIDDQNQLLYVAAQALSTEDPPQPGGDLSGILYVFQTDTSGQYTAFEIGTEPTDVALSPLGERVYVATSGLGDNGDITGIAVYRSEDITSSEEPVGIIDLGQAARLLVSPQTGSLFVLQANGTLVAWSDESIQTWLEETDPPTSGPANPRNQDLTAGSSLPLGDGSNIMSLTQDGRYLFILYARETSSQPIRIVHVSRLFSSVDADITPASTAQGIPVAVETSADNRFVTVLWESGLSMQITADNENPSDGDLVTLTATLENLTPNPIDDIDSVLTFDNLTFNSATAPAGSTFDDGTQTWSVTSLAAGASLQLTIEATADATGTDERSVVARLTAPGHPVDDGYQAALYLNSPKPAVEVNQSTLTRYEIVQSGGNLALLERGVGGEWKGKPLDLTVSPREKWAYVLQDVEGQGRIQAISIEAASKNSPPSNEELLGEREEIVGDVQFLRQRFGGKALYAATDDVPRGLLPESGSVVIVEVEEADCRGLFNTAIDGCVTCEEDEQCVVLAHVPLYKPGQPIENPNVGAPDGNILDNLTFRPIVPSSSTIKEVIECLIDQGFAEGIPGPRGPNGNDGENGINGIDGQGITEVRFSDGNDAEPRPFLEPTGTGSDQRLVLDEPQDGQDGRGITEVRFATPADTEQPPFLEDINGGPDQRLVLPAPDAQEALTHIEKINWVHGDIMTTDQFHTLLSDPNEGLQIIFDKEVDIGTICNYQNVSGGTMSEVFQLYGRFQDERGLEC